MNHPHTSQFRKRFNKKMQQQKILKHLKIQKLLFPVLRGNQGSNHNTGHDTF